MSNPTPFVPLVVGQPSFPELHMPEYTSYTHSQICREVQDECRRIEQKFGVLNHPSLDQTLLQRPGGCSEARMAEEYGIPTAGVARANCQLAERRGELTFAHILMEEVSEAVAERDEANMREELLQVAAVAVTWVAAIDRRLAAKLAAEEAASVASAAEEL